VWIPPTPGLQPLPCGAFQGKAALIIRGTCEFGVKALNAQNAGATMFIIYNNEARAMKAHLHGARRGGQPGDDPGRLHRQRQARS
jgi:hypothetical protein